MYAAAPLRRSTAQRIGNVAGLLQTYYQETNNLIALKEAYERVETVDPTATDDDIALHTYIDGLYELDEIADFMLAIDEAAATITDWDVDHADLLGI